MILPPSVQRRRTWWAFGAVVATLLWLGSCPAGAAPDSRPKTFALPAADAAVTLNKFAEQSGEQVIYLIEQVRGIRTNPVHGSYTAREAIQRLIAETRLRVVEDKDTGALMIQRRTPDAAPGAPKPSPPSKS